MVSNRESIQNQSLSGAVNEFLSQLDNIGTSGVFVISSTNRANMLDKAILHAGRLEKWFYILPPDFEARKVMFELNLKKKIAFTMNILYEFSGKRTMRVQKEQKNEL
ncbi:MAG: ATP-binding protein [Bacteroidales bacterium]|jgi:transitional endoplasmic reticulum ATPase|nr:ATP-binding protein [Bacteroidales bacterium]